MKIKAYYWQGDIPKEIDRIEHITVIPEDRLIYVRDDIDRQKHILNISDFRKIEIDSSSWIEYPI